MEPSDFLRQIRWMRNRLNHRRNLLIAMLGRPFLSTQLAQDSEALLHQLDVTELMAMASRPRPRVRRSLPSTFHQRYDCMIQDLEHEVVNATQQMLVRERRVSQVVVTWFDVHANANANANVSCRICMQVFEEGEVAGELRGCSHRFHLTCIAQRYMLRARCPVCDHRI